MFRSTRPRESYNPVGVAFLSQGKLSAHTVPGPSYNTLQPYTQSVRVIGVTAFVVVVVDGGGGGCGVGEGGGGSCAVSATGSLSIACSRSFTACFLHLCEGESRRRSFDHCSFPHLFSSFTATRDCAGVELSISRLRCWAGSTKI